jgi:pimeloyl-ACP methyl ester carboxylesterase
LAEYIAIARHYSIAAVLPSITCPVLIAYEEADPLAATAFDVYDALPGPKTLVRFLTSEGAGDHCAMMARALFHQRAFDWLDDVLAGACADRP